MAGGEKIVMVMMAGDMRARGNSRSVQKWVEWRVTAAEFPIVFHEGGIELMRVEMGRGECFEDV